MSKYVWEMKVNVWDEERKEYSTSYTSLFTSSLKARRNALDFIYSFGDTRPETQDITKNFFIVADPHNRAICYVSRNQVL